MPGPALRPAVDDRRHGNPGIQQLVRQSIAPIVVGGHDRSIAGADKVPVHQALQATGQKYPRQVVVFKYHRVFIAAGCHNDALRFQRPEFAFPYDGQDAFIIPGKGGCAGQHAAVVNLPDSRGQLPGDIKTALSVRLNPVLSYSAVS